MKKQVLRLLRLNKYLNDIIDRQIREIIRLKAAITYLGHMADMHYTHEDIRDKAWSYLENGLEDENSVQS